MNDKKIITYLTNYITKVVNDINHTETQHLTDIEKDNRILAYNDILKRIDVLKNDKK